MLLCTLLSYLESNSTNSKPKKGDSNPAVSRITIGSYDSEEELDFLRPLSEEPGSFEDTDQSMSSTEDWSSESVDDATEEENTKDDMSIDGAQSDHLDSDSVGAIEDSDIEDVNEDIQPRLKRLRLQ